ncbi:MAG: DUF4433 domain-containing protein [Thermoanaerobaculia bacterium]|nr:DUF4433 domain-containing protein [Thermoanaerobaculia bacterium]
MPIPPFPKIYHITHVDNLSGIVAAGCLWSDSERIVRSADCRVVGMGSIKRRRLERLVVRCHPGTMVGEYVPFYFCPRSVMLYILHMGNHPDLDYTGGQRAIVHLQADLRKTIQWASTEATLWAFTDRNAAVGYAGFYHRWSDLEMLDWRAIQATDFREPAVKEGKQAEFLVYRRFPWSLVEGIGVVDSEMAKVARAETAEAAHRPKVQVERGWYYRR